jgi:hypothetical protein
VEAGTTSVAAAPALGNKTRFRRRCRREPSNPVLAISGLGSLHPRAGRDNNIGLGGSGRVNWASDIQTLTADVMLKGQTVWFKPTDLVAFRAATSSGG